MKRLIVFAMLGIATLAVTPAKAQVSVSVNIGSQPNWGPRGYNYVDYYYLPEVESYYYVPTRKFIYLSGGNWVHSRNLPKRYRHYDLHRGRKIVINDHRPYLRHKDYRKRYSNNYVYSKPRRVSERTSYYRSESKHYRKSDKHWNKGNKHNRGRDHDRGRDRGRH